VIFVNGSLCGCLAVHALATGAKHVTCCEPSRYSATACTHVLEANGFCAASDAFVMGKGPTDIVLGRDGVNGPYNVVVIVSEHDAGLATGTHLSLQYTIDNLTTRDVIVLPSFLRLFVQAASVRTTECCGLDMSAVNELRSVSSCFPKHTAGTNRDFSMTCTQIYFGRR
jgi:hypothetical protein